MSKFHKKTCEETKEDWVGFQKKNQCFTTKHECQRIHTRNYDQRLVNRHQPSLL